MDNLIESSEDLIYKKSSIKNPLIIKKCSYPECNILVKTNYKANVSCKIHRCATKIKKQCCFPRYKIPNIGYSLYCYTHYAYYLSQILVNNCSKCDKCKDCINDLILNLNN